MDMDEEVDFDFFETPRNDKPSSPKSKKMLDKPPNPASAHEKHGDQANGKQRRNDRSTSNDRVKINSKEKTEYDYSDDSFSSSDTESETPRYNHSKTKENEKSNKKTDKKRSDSSMSESSSAYSNSDYSSDDDRYEKYNRKERKETIDVHIPKAHVEAWGDSETKKGQDSAKKYSNRNSRDRRRRSVSESESDSGDEQGKRESRKSHKVRNERVNSAKDKSRRDNNRKKTLRSSSSYSNNSDITDVSPLESPEGSPRLSHKQTKANKERQENRKSNKVQCSDSGSPYREVDHSINLESDQIDLSILMKCMADIDREKQQRLKTNSRRVMFAPPTANENSKGNYTFSVGRAKLIEKENQRLLKQIMTQMNSSSVKKAPGTAPRQKGPRKAFEPTCQRLTPSAVNRMREQRRIEAENMQMLQRLQTAKPTKGMARNEQINEAERQMSYGIPSGTVIVSGQRSHYDTMSQRSLQSSMSYTAGSTQRSRPSSAKSNASSVVITPGKRSRPSSAKSNASMRSNASIRSTASKRSTISTRSGFLAPGVRKMADGRIDNRPTWDDRFSYS